MSGLKASQEIEIYDLATSQKVKSIKTKENPILIPVLKNDGVLYSTMAGDVFEVDPRGNAVKTYSQAGYLMTLSDEETEMITVNKTGEIKVWDILTGKILAQVTDTFVATEKPNESIVNTKVKTPPYKISSGAYYLIPYSTGIMSLYSTNEKKVIANLFFDETDWAVIAADGRFDGTVGSFDKLEWREYQGQRLINQYTVETSFDKYFTPRLLYSLLHPDQQVSVPPPNPIIISRIPSLVIHKFNEKSIASSQGILTLEALQKNGSLTFKSNELPEKIKEVRLYHNNKLVSIQPKNETAIYSFGITLNSVNGDSNYFYAVAATGEGIDSEKTKVIINYRVAEVTKPKLQALIVGINNYKNPRYTLNYALSDAKSMQQQLELTQSELFESVQVKTLYDGNATKTDIVNAFNEFSATLTEQDIFLFYYAGHGTMHDGNSTQEFYIVPYDVIQLYGNEDELQKKAISAAEIKNLSMKINAQKQIFIIDACHSAGALTAAATRGAAEERAIGQLARSTGTFWITAAGSDQFATEFEQLGHGVFTYSLLEALQGKDQGHSSDGIITIREISSYVEQRVPEISEKYKGKPQYPSSFSFGNDFPLILLKK